MPKHTHDCQSCTFLGTDKQGTDWYVCGSPESRSLIRRFSSEGSDYVSVPIAGTVQMSRLEQRAVRMGFQFNSHELERFGRLYVESKKQYSSMVEAQSCDIDMEDDTLLAR